MRRTRRLAALLFLALATAGLAAACSSASSSSAPSSSAPKKKKDPGVGVRVLDCVVVERGQDAPSQASGYASGATYYLVFETKEGDATARYRFEVNRQQWFRYQEGARVRITLSNNILTDIRTNNEP